MTRFVCNNPKCEVIRTTLGTKTLEAGRGIVKEFKHWSKGQLIPTCISCDQPLTELKPLTDLEKDALMAFWRSEYQDGEETPCVWSWSVTDHCQVVTKKQISGVLGSLARKGYVTASGYQPGEQDGAQSIGVTEEGFAAAKAAGLIVSHTFESSGEKGRMVTQWKPAEQAVVTPPSVMASTNAIVGAGKAVKKAAKTKEPGKVYRLSPGIAQVLQLDDDETLASYGITVVKHGKTFLDVTFSHKEGIQLFLDDCDSRARHTKDGWNQPLWYASSAFAVAASLRKQGLK